MKTILKITLLFFFPFFISAQNNNQIRWDWAKVYGNTYNSIANKVLVDAGKNVYVCGSFIDTLIVEQDTLLSGTGAASFLGKFDVSGKLIWIKSLLGKIKVQEMKFDALLNIHLLFDESKLMVASSANGNTIRAFNMPLSDANGRFYANDFELDQDGNTYVLTKNEENGSSNQSAIISKFDKQYGSIWQKSFHYSDDFNYGGLYSLCIDANSNIYFTGTTSFHSGLIMNGTNIQAITDTLGPKLFIIKMNNLGQALWVKTEPIDFIEQFGMEVNSLDSSIYLTGYQVSDWPIEGDTLKMSATNAQQIYLLKYNLNGNYKWAKAFPVTIKSTREGVGASGTRIFISDSGNVYLKGIFSGSMLFHNDTLREDTSVVLNGTIADDVFIAKLNPSGNPIWGKYGGNASAGNLLDDGDFYIDELNQTIFMVGFNVTPNATAIQNIFIAKEKNNIITSNDEIDSQQRVMVFPNPTNGKFTIKGDQTQTTKVDLEICNVLGERIYYSTIQSPINCIIDFSSQPKGIYFTKVQAAKKVYTFKLVVQ